MGDDYEAALELFSANEAAAIGKYLTSVSYIRLGSTPEWSSATAVYLTPCSV